MTQAYNLSQLANNLNSSGRLDATDGLVNAVPVANGGTGASTAAAARTNLDVAASVFSVPSGGIILWSGAVASIPTGWVLCNGANGTPDLRDRFVVGAGSSYSVGSAGGSKDAIVVSHSHSATSSVNDPGHAHQMAGYFYDAAEPRNANRASYPDYYQGQLSTNAATTNISVSTSISSTGTTGVNANLPPYYALAYIMKT
jgi:microcystin-dependent protein